MSMFPKVGIKEMSENIFEVLDLALQDRIVDVQAKDVASMPILAFNSSYDVITTMCRRLEVFVEDKYDKVCEIVAHDIGYIACLSATPLATHYVTNFLCQIHKNVGLKVSLGNIDVLILGLFCAQCDKKISGNSGKSDLDVTLYKI